MEKNCERLPFYPFAIVDRNRAIPLGVNSARQTRGFILGDISRKGGALPCPVDGIE